MKIIHIGIIIIYFLLLILAFLELTSHYICDDKNCSAFQHAEKQTGTKNQILFLLNKLCEESTWIYAYIGSSILTPLFFIILPLRLNFEYFAMTFLIIFITLYCIFSFFVYHYVIPVKKYIIDYINKM